MINVLNYDKNMLTIYWKHYLNDFSDLLKQKILKTQQKKKIVSNINVITHGIIWNNV